MTDASAVPRPPLVVGTDSAAVTRSFRGPLVLMVTLAIVCAAAAAVFAALLGSVSSFGLGMLAALPFLFVMATQVYAAVRIAGLAAARASAGTVLTLDGVGLASRTPQGLVVLPWQAIASVEVRQRGRRDILVFRIADGVTPESLGVRVEMNPAVFRQLKKRGFHLGSIGIDVSIEMIIDATSVFTAGRLAAALGSCSVKGATRPRSQRYGIRGDRGAHRQDLT